MALTIPRRLPRRPTKQVIPTKRRTALALIGGTALTPLMTPGPASAATARAYAQHATLTELGPSDIAELEAAVDGLGTLYSSQPPHELWPTAARMRHRVFTFQHERRHTLREARELARHAGMLSVILAWVTHDLGEGDLVQAYCDDAWAQGEQADLPEVGAWAEDVRSTHALYDSRPLDALLAATRGLAVAPRDGNAAVRLSAQVARAHARLGNHHEFERAAVRARDYQAQLPLHGTGLFGVDAVRITSYDASSYGWLSHANRARAAAEEAIGHYRSFPRPLQAQERLALGEAYTVSGYVLVHEAGDAFTIKQLCRRAYPLMELLGLRRVRLYDARSSCFTFLANNGVPDHILARWAGHTNIKTTKRWYVKPDVEDLREAATTWDGLHGVAEEGQA
ncbi:hypothetical protein AB0H86_00175 [Streptomyces sp. NPDC050997]|uniref:hypothetical protein n=1 Tax=Streptomyces sp. NPDC050997 TaxID=3155519 RepID=UPI003437FA9F